MFRCVSNEKVVVMGGFSDFRYQGRILFSVEFDSLLAF